jgi:PAS domain S-box-containing protein
MQKGFINTCFQMSIPFGKYAGQSNEGFRILFENFPDAIFVEDEDGFILNVNQAACELQGITHDRLTGMNITELVPADKTEELLERHKKWFLGEISYYEGIVYSVSGKIIPVEMHGRIVYFSEKPSLLLFIRDISGRKEALVESEEKFRNIFERSPDAIALTTPVGTIIDMNKAAIELFRFPGKFSYNNMSCFRLVDAKDHNRALKSIRTVIERGKVKNKTFTLVRPDGTSFMAEISASLLQNKNREPVNLIFIAKDITQRLLYERRLEEASRKAIESDRLKSAFLSNMSHEIRTPMNAIIGFSKLLSSQQNNESDNSEYIEIIKNTGNTLLTLIDDIIDFAKIESGEVMVKNTACNVHKTMRELYTFFETERIRNGKTEIELLLNMENPGHELVILTDQDRFRQIFSNLLSNAIKFTKKGTVEFGYKIEDKNVNFYVRDTGIGIPKDKHLVIFDRFRQVEFDYNRKFGGTGLGLAITKNLVNLLGGKILLESRPGLGSVFRFSLPLVRVENPDQKSINKLPEMSYYHWKNKVILIVEDNELNSRLLQRMIEPSEAKLIFAKDGKPAIEACRDNPDIDLVLMDIQMPEMDGYEATRTIKAMHPGIPVIAQTAYAMTEERERIIDAGCDDYLSKPIRQKDLFRILSKYLNQ